MSRVELPAAPRLAALYARALQRQLPVIGGGGGDALPETELVLADATVDRDHLAAYDAVCGFRLSDVAPPTYLHVLAFPLAMRLMTDGDFPFGVMGLVHIANRIDQHRPVRAGESVELRVRADDLRDHERGRQFDVVGEAWSSDELVWEDRSTYLRRGGGSSPAAARKPRADEPAPPSGGAIWRVPGDVGRRYASVSGDRNPIHLHGATAKLFGQPAPIAHGMWLKARCLAALEGRFGESCSVAVRFKLPVRLGSKVRFASALDADGTRSFEVRSADDGKPHLSGTLQAR
jgi:acyl dehydratase